jgi:CO/xanthine dehydrogenase Mo-binding subunit
VIADDFAGVVAESRAAAQAAVARIHATWKKAIAGSRQSWSSWSRWESDGAVIQEVGDVSRRLGDGATLTAEYRTPLAVHTPLEAQAALADVQPDRVRVWCSTQGQGFVRGQVAKAIRRGRKNCRDPSDLCGEAMGARQVGKSRSRLLGCRRRQGCRCMWGGRWPAEEMRYGVSSSA